VIQIEVVSLFNDKKRAAHVKRNKNMHLLKLEGAYLFMNKLYGSNGYLNIKAHDYFSQTSINLNIQDVQNLLDLKVNKVKARVTIFTFEDSIDELTESFSTRLTCELN
jgi:hypothetical protein